MASVEERKLGAIVGGIVPDAAAVPIHWIYDLAKLTALLGDKDEIEFHDPPGNPFYRIPTGLNSCYGDQAIVLLQSLVACKGLDTADLVKRSYTKFGPGSAYENPVIDNYVPKSGSKLALPINTPWKHVSVKHFLKNAEENAACTGSETDQQMDGVVRLAPIVALYAGRPELLDKVEESCRVMQNSDFTVTCVLAAARLLEHYILHGPDPDALVKVIAQLDDPNRKNPQELDKGMAAHLRKVMTLKDTPHKEAVLTAFKND